MGRMLSATAAALILSSIGAYDRVASNASTLLAADAALPAAQNGAPAKSFVCHVDSLGSFRLLELTTSALPAHMAHGDGSPGGPVPNQAEVFGQACERLPDGDQDGVADGVDNCPAVANPDQADVDEDGTGNACDATNDRDRDNDGWSNEIDNCPDTFNLIQEDGDSDGIGDACDPIDDRNPDTDSDGAPDADDNCPTVPNSTQSDTDLDGIGDACDPVNDLDVDGDGVPNADDNCPTAPNSLQTDSDGDDVGDACEVPDNYEPNDTLAAAADLGNLTDGEQGGINGNFHDGIDEEDYFRLNLQEDSDFCVPGSSQSYRLRLQLDVPAGLDLDLYVTAPDGTLLGQSVNSGNATENIDFDFPGTCGLDDSRQVIVLVRRFSGAPADALYTLSFSFGSL